MLARAVREVEIAVDRRQVTSSQHARFQAVALIARAERDRIRGDQALSPAQRDTQLKRLDGVAEALARLGEVAGEIADEAPHPPAAPALAIWGAHLVRLMWPRSSDAATMAVRPESC